MYTVFQPFLIHLFNSFIYSFVFAQFNIKTETGTVHLARWVWWTHTSNRNKEKE